MYLYICIVIHHVVLLVHCVAKVWYFDHRTISRLFWRAFVGQRTIRLIQWWLSRNSFSFGLKVLFTKIIMIVNIFNITTHSVVFFISMIYFEHRPDERHQVEIGDWSPLVNYYPSLKSGDSIRFQVIMATFIMMIVDTINIEKY